MRDFISIGVLVNTVSMLAASRDGAMWVSDSEEDASFYEAQLADKRVVVISASGHASDVLNALLERGIQGVVATPTANKAAGEHEFSLGAGDVTSLLMRSRGFEQVLVNIVGRAWLDACKRDAAKFRQHIFDIACAIHAVRTALGVHAVDKEAMLAVAETVISWSDFTIPDSSLIRANYDNHNLNALDVALERCKAGNGFCTGQDVTAVLIAAIQNFAPRGLKPMATIDATELLRNLRSGYEVSDFESDSMFWHMREWQRKWRYPLLREWRELDPLGVLWDQRYWENDLTKLLASEEPRPMAAFKMDLDNFKLVNEALGHSGGDDAIRLYCRLVKEILGPVAEVYRRGGDEVVAFASGLLPMSAKELAEDLRARIQQSFATWSSSKGLTAPPTASIGLVVWSSGTTEHQVKTSLDEAQLRAKQEGKNRVVHLTI